MTKTAIHLPHGQWAAADAVWRGHVEGREIGTGVTVLFFSTDEEGGGPRLHLHPYDEVFIVRTGRALFTIGDRTIEAGAGDILMAPATVPHRFRNLGPGRLETTDIHLSDRWIQTDLPDTDPHPEPKTGRTDRSQRLSAAQ